MTTGATRPGDALSETQRRFLVAVMERVPRALVHEVYLFAPMKQGGIETGIAVVAIAEPTPDDADAAPADPVGQDEVGLPADGAGDGVSDEASMASMAAVGCDPTEAAADADIGSPILPDDGPQPPPAPTTRTARFTVVTARYRLQLKGPERGKWDVDVVEEADAPLVTVDAVVRGVHRRSGEPSEAERLAPHDIARALGEVPWTSGN